MRLASGVAAAVLAVTLLHDSFASSRLSHPRALPVLVGAGVIAAALLILAPRARSRWISLGAGIAAGGALATLVTGLAWQHGVPNPLVAGGVAFNVADLAIAAGDALLVAAALTHAWTHRAQLHERI
jgi:lipoprotein signal peptidase